LQSSPNARPVRLPRAFVRKSGYRFFATNDAQSTQCTIGPKSIMLSAPLHCDLNRPQKCAFVIGFALCLPAAARKTLLKGCSLMSQRNKVEPPVIAKRPTVRVVHGVELHDEYSWLRAPNWRDVLRDPATLPTEIAGVLDAENLYAERVLEPTRERQKELAAEMRARMKEDDAQVPFADGDWLYYMRFRQGGQHPLICRRPRAGGDEMLLLDGDKESDGKVFFDIGGAEHSPDQTRLGWSADPKGSELYEIKVRDLSAASDAADVVNDTDGTIVWSSASDAFYYVRVDDNHRTSQVFRHRLASAPTADELIVEELDPAWFVHVRASRGKSHMIVMVTDHQSSENYLVDLADPAARARLVAPRIADQRYDVHPSGARLFIRTNADGAEDFKIVSAPIADPGRENWVDVVPHRLGTMVTGVAVFKDYLVWFEREAGLPRIVVRHLASGDDHRVAFDEEAYSLDFQENYEYDSNVLRFAYSSMTTPREIYDYDLATRERLLRKRQEIPSGHDPSHYVTRRLFAKAPDGESVPISLLYRKDTALDGSAPLLLYGYGSYGAAMPASFGANRLSLVDRGFVYAIAHIRGGSDKGWHWYLDGKLAKKQNTFSDFICVARHLIAEGFTRKGRIVAQGGSAGGLLMGAIANQAPDLFAGIIANVPFVDALNTILDAELPLTPPEWLEWGNPITDPKAFATMRAYSPYDNVGAHVYPPILALSGLTDPRVTYWEPAKWVARLRATMTGGGPILLKTNMGAGHGGASGRFDHLAEVALEYAFALACAQGLFAA
jgi:oligopeptidase B